jgi:hypothetical protein
MPKNWDRTHNPDARPLGCNGKYGSSGRGRHKYYGTPVCDACKASDNHYCKELRRGQNIPRKKPFPCGTPAAAYQHRLKGERLDMACVEAEIQGKREYRARKAHPQVSAELALLYEEATRLTTSILQRRKRRCISSRKHTPGRCKHCGVHVPKGQIAKG